MFNPCLLLSICASKKHRDDVKKRESAMDALLEDNPCIECRHIDAKIACICVSGRRFRPMMSTWCVDNRPGLSSCPRIRRSGVNYLWLSYAISKFVKELRYIPE